MTRLSEQKAKMGRPVPADPLPKEKVEGDSADTDVHDDNDTPPGIDPKSVKR